MEEWFKARMFAAGGGDVHRVPDCAINALRGCVVGRYSN